MAKGPSMANPNRLALACLLLWISSGAFAAEITLRLVRDEAPDQLASTAITHIDVESEKAKAKADEQAAEAKAKAAGRGFVPKDQPSAPKAEFDRYSNYMRGIVIDHKHPFNKSYQGSYLGRSDVIKLNLEDGEHVIDPGSHKFSVQAGKVSSADASLKANGGTLDIVLYPIGIVAVDGSCVRETPAEARRLPVSPRIYCGEEELLPKEDNLSPSATFKRLTLHMIANTEGAGYRVSPSDVNFHVTENGAVIVDAAGKTSAGSGVGIEDRYTLVMPKVAVPVYAAGNDIQILIAGPAGQLKLATEARTRYPQIFYMYPAPGGADITIGRRASNKPLHLDGDLGAYPRRRIVIDGNVAETREPRMLVAASPGYNTDSGKPLRVRLDCLDTLDVSTVAPLQVAAFIAKTPVLRDDGELGELPADDSAATEWLTARVMSTPEPNLYDVIMPDLPSNVYRLRLVAGRRGNCSPLSPLRADFVQGIINPAARTNLSVFSPSGRHGFVTGADIPVSIAVKSTAAVPAGRLTVSLFSKTSAGDANEYKLLEQDFPERAAGLYPLHFKLGANATAALAPGDYVLSAKLAGIESNHWTIHISEPRYLDPFIYFNDGWGGGGNIDQGTKYFTLPRDIADANEKRSTLRRNAEVLGRLDAVNFAHPPQGCDFKYYEGRDSSSEVAEVERILRGNLSLPAPEVFYYQNHFETECEVLASHGMGHYQCLMDGFSPRSLCHTVVTELNAKMRQYQLTAQLGKKFENFTGMALVMDDTTPTGDTEVGDNGRTVRLVQQMENFIKKYGFRPPSGGEAAKFLMAYKEGKVTPELATVAKQWEAWAEDENCLLGDYYAMGRDAVKPLNPDMAFPIEGPGWGSTWDGGYPVTSHRFQSPQTVQTGSGDYGMMMILDPLTRTRYFKMANENLWGIIGENSGAPGFYNLKNHFIGFVAAGVTGVGYYSGEVSEGAAPAATKNLGLHEERQDVRELIQTYGPLFRQIQPTSEIGILYPFHQSMYEVMHIDLGNGKMADSRNASFACISQLAMLGYNSEMLTEEMLDDKAGPFASGRYKVIIAPALYYLLPRHLEALEKFAVAGGTVLVGSHSTLLPKGAKKIDGDDFMECVQADDMWTFNKLQDVGHAWMFGEMRRKVPALRKALEPVLKPFAQPATDRVLVQTSRGGQGRYTFVWDNLFPSWMGTPRVSQNAEYGSGLGEANETTLMPLKENISFPAQMYTYELFTQKPIAEGAKPAGRAETSADLSYTPFRIFVSIPKPIASIKVEIPAAIELGMHFPVKITPLDAEGLPINVAVPLRIALNDEAGANVYQTTGVTAESKICEKEFKAPLGRKPGQWKIVVDELISGRKVQAAIAVSAAQSLPFGAAVQTTPVVDVQRPDLVRDFIAARKKDGKTVLILLGESQAARKSLAEDAAKALAALGVKTEIKQSSQPGVYASGERVHLYKNWGEPAPAQYIEHPLVLLGGEGENTLIEELQENQLLTRSLSASYPGPGRGILTVVRSPFAYNSDVLCLFAPDEAGVRAAIGELSKTTSETPAAAANKPPAELKLAAQTLPGTLVPGTPFAAMDGAPVQTLSVSEDGARIGFGTLGYAKNVFVFDASTGKPLYEDKVGHVNTMGIVLPKNSQQTLVSSDGTSYLREADGKLAWRLRDVQYADPSLRYLVLPVGLPDSAAGFAVYDTSFKLLWKFDDWDTYQTTQEILFARRAKFIAAVDGGNTIAYRLHGKAPGISEKYCDDLVYCDALTGQEKRRVTLPTQEIFDASGLTILLPGQGGSGASVESLSLFCDGAFAIATVEANRQSVPVLLDANLKPLAHENFKVPPYVGGIIDKSHQFLLADRRLIFTVGDTLCISDAAWKTLETFKTDNLILSMIVDAPRRRIAISNYSGPVTLLEYSDGSGPLALRKLWQIELESAAMLAFLPDGKLAAGTLRGHALLLGAEGKQVWTNTLDRYAEPDEVERRWSELEALPTLKRPGSEPWWEQVKINAGLKPDIAGLAGNVTETAPLAGAYAGVPFGTYIVEWKHRRTKGGPQLTLEITDSEKVKAGEKPVVQHRISLSARPQETESTERALLRLGDRPDKIQISVQCAGAGSEAASSVSILPLAFPSDDLIRIPSLYRDKISEDVRANPPVLLDLFINVTEEDNPFTTRWIDPYNFVNGKLCEKEPALLGGKWFGSGNAFMPDTWEQVPCWIDIQLPQKKVITHVVVGEDPSLGRTDTISIDAYVESRENRKGLSEFEKRQATRGFWYNTVKARGNTNAYNVYKLDKPIFTRKLRIYILSGHTSVNEIELYGALPAKKETGDK